MKVSILTIQSINYGNRLQNYALQTVLKSYGHEVESLRREAGFEGSLRFRLRAIKRAVGLMTKHRSDRIGAFKAFDRAHIVFSDEVVSKELTSSDLADKYDCFVIGSDQVWNPDFDFNSDLEYLPMVSSAKKISYAASFGVSEIVDNREETAALLNNISLLSVREDDGASIVRDLTDKEAAVVADPTLLLGPQDWERISKRPVKAPCDRPYIFKYVLGNDVNEKKIAAMAANRSLDIVDVMDESLAIGPSEFVWLIAHSELVCTDSFHASVFALLHHKPLAIFERVSDDADMSSRFDTLCSAFGLAGHRSSESNFGDEAIFGTDWSAFEERLEELRNRSREWLVAALEGVARG